MVAVGAADAADLEDISLAGGGSLKAGLATPDTPADTEKRQECERDDEDAQGTESEEEEAINCAVGLASFDGGTAGQIGFGGLTGLSILSMAAAPLAKETSEGSEDPNEDSDGGGITPPDPNVPAAQINGVVGLADDYHFGLQVSFTRSIYDAATNDYEVFLDDDWASMVSSGGTSAVTGSTGSLGGFIRRADYVDMSPTGGSPVFWIRGEGENVSQIVGGFPMGGTNNTFAMSYAGDGNQNAGYVYVSNSMLYHSSHGRYNNPPGPDLDGATVIVDDFGHADIDGDGDTDLYILDYSTDTAEVWDVDDNDATQMPDSSAALTIAWGDVRAKAIGFGANEVYGAVIWDFDGDGDDDDIVVNTDIGGLYYPDFLSVNYAAPAGNATDLLASWDNDTGLAGADGVLGLDDTDGDGSIDSFLLTVYDQGSGDFQIYQFDDLANLGRQTLLGGDTLSDELEATCGYNGFYKASYSFGGSITSDFITFSPYDTRTAVIDTSVDPNLSPGVIQVDQALMAFEYTQDGITTTDMTMSAVPATPMKNSGDVWGVEDLDGDNEAEFWHWHKASGYLHAYEFDDLGISWDITHDSYLSAKLNTAWNAIDAVANPTDVDSMLIYDFDGDGDADLGLSADGAVYDVAVYEFLL